MFAERHKWTPEQVARLDPDFVDEQMIYWKAERDHQELERKRHERRQRRRQE